ncbi:ABC transporter ATP-binding protein [Pseudohongiella spirulinae]|uniref:ABC transporter ATP-binding protein n=1 Tax=Pseudohongiella spirulinae TaxID=1249552 RepID=A0A0S2KBE3_9GAMM|nr:ABC transporter ATP-binding protein [Pseudohongiella spirulinae]ALO45427.1 ABC transporter ATP-binding protein [Pseudohongiella spirulinae]
MTHALQINNISVALEGTPIVHAISLKLKEGDIGCLLGPSGCGKTTLLRAIAGFEAVTGGEVIIGGEVVSRAGHQLPVERRQVGMVFQDYALFPHLNIRDNIAFGLNGWKAADKQKRVQELAQLLHIGELLDAYPHRLSGGQQQRVAIARAMAPRPRILLLDEPFASLDVELREEIAREIREVLKQDGITTILVSHNQLEAFAMADEIGVMRAGQLLQWSSAFDLYHEPQSAYVADFVGEGVFLPGTVIDTLSVSTELGVLHTDEDLPYASGELVSVLIRPDDVIHDDDSHSTAKVLEKAFRGSVFLYTLELDSGARILSLVPSHHAHAKGSAIGIRVEMDHLVVFPVEAETPPER